MKKQTSCKMPKGKMMKPAMSGKAHEKMESKSMKKKEAKRGYKS